MVASTSCRFFLFISVVVSSCFAQGRTTLYVHEDPVGDEGRIYPLNQAYVPGSLDLTNFTVAYDTSMLYFSFSFGFIGNPFGGSYGFSHPMCQMFIDTDRIPNSGSLNSLTDIFDSKASISPEYPYEYRMLFQGWYSFIEEHHRNPYSTDNRFILRPKVDGNTIEIQVPISKLAAPSTLWAYTVWCGSENFGRFRPVGKYPGDYEIGGGADTGNDPNLVDFLVSPDIKKVTVWNLYKEDLPTTVPAVGNSVYSSTKIFAIADAPGDEVYEYPIYQDLRNGTFDIIGLQVLENPDFIIVQLQMKALTPGSSSGQSFQYLKAHVYIDVDDIVGTGQLGVISSNLYKTSDQRGWEIGIVFDGTKAVLWVHDNKAVGKLVSKGNVDFTSGNGYIKAFIPKYIVSSLTSVGSQKRWKYIALAGFEQAIPSESQGSRQSEQTELSVMDILDFQNLCQQQILDFSRAKIEIPFINMRKLAHMVLYEKYDDANDEVVNYPLSSSYSKWKQDKGLLDLDYILVSSDSIELRVLVKMKASDLVDDSTNRAPVIIRVLVDMDGVFSSGRVDDPANMGLSIHPVDSWEYSITIDAFQRAAKVDFSTTTFVERTVQVQGSYIIYQTLLSKLRIKTLSKNWKFAIASGGCQGDFQFIRVQQEATNETFGYHEKITFQPNVADIIIPSGVTQAYLMTLWNGQNGSLSFLPFDGKNITYYGTDYLILDAEGDELGLYPQNPFFTNQQGLFDIQYFGVRHDDQFIYFDVSLKSIVDMPKNRNPIGLLGLQIYIDIDRTWFSGGIESVGSSGIGFHPNYAWEYVLQLTRSMNRFVRFNHGNQTSDPKDFHVLVQGNSITITINRGDIDIPHRLWSYTIVSGGVLDDTNTGSFVPHNKYQSMSQFGGGDDSDFYPNIVDFISPRQNEKDLVWDFSPLRNKRINITPLGFDVLQGQLYWDGLDKEGDEFGKYPSSIPGASGFFDILGADLGILQNGFWIRVNMKQILQKTDSEKLFEHLLLQIYIDADKSSASGSKTVFGNANVQFSTSSGWEHAFIIDGNKTVYKAFENGAEKDKSKQVHTRVEGHSIVVEVHDVDISKSPNPIYSFISGGYDESTSGFIGFCKDPQPNCFGSGQTSSYQPNIADILTNNPESQDKFFSSWSEVEKRYAALHFVDPQDFDQIFRSEDGHNDEFGLYPTATEFGGTRPSGLFDLKSFSVSANYSHVSVEVEFHNQISNPYAWVYGFSPHYVTIFYHKDRTQVRTESPDQGFFDLSSPWHALMKVSGQALQLSYPNANSVNPKLVTKNSFMNRLEVLEQNKIKIFTSKDSVGDIDQTWTYSIAVGIYDEISKDFMIRNENPSDRFLGGGSDDYYDPNAIDILIPPSKNVKIKDHDRRVQDSILGGYDNLKRIKSLIPSFGPGVDWNPPTIEDSFSSANDSSEQTIVLAVSVSVAGVLFIVASFVFKKYRDRLNHVAKIEQSLYMYVNHDDIEIGELLGMGSFGQVNKGIWRGAEVAIKKLHVDTTNVAVLREFEHEVSVMVELRHPNLVLYMGVCKISPNMCILSELMANGSLYEVLHDQYLELTHEMRIGFLLDAAKGMQYLHTSTPSILHRDLKSPNLLLDSRWNLKISDFGLSGFNTDHQTEKRVGSLLWMAPEIVEENECTWHADVYSYGIIIWEVFSRKEPYEGEDAMAVAMRVSLQSYRPPMPEGGMITADMERMMKECWSQEKTKRPPFSLIVSQINSMKSSIRLTSGSTSKRSASITERTTREQPSGIFAIVYLGIDMASDLWDLDGEMVSMIIQEYYQIIQKGCSIYTGYESDVNADNILLGFSDILNALEFADFVDSKMLEVKWPERWDNIWPTKTISHENQYLFRGPRIKTTIHWGEPRSQQYEGQRNVKYTGRDVDLCLSLWKLAVGGQILLSSKAHEALKSQGFRQELYAILEIKSLSLADSGESESIFQIISNKKKERVSHFDLDLHRNGHKEADWQVAFEQISVSNTSLGSGSYGTVYKVDFKGTSYAMKKLHRQTMTTSQYMVYMKEILLMRSLHHPHVVQLHGACMKAPNLCMLIELAEYGSLQAVLLNTKIPLDDMTKTRALLQISDAMKFLHQQTPAVIHRDLKSTNILVFNLSPIVVKVGDFGFARIKLENQTMTKCGTRAWLAPEIILGNHYNEKVDVFSYSIMCWEVFHRDVPYKNLDGIRVNASVLKGVRPTLSKVPSKDIEVLLQQGWDENPERRPTFTTIHSTLDAFLKK